MAEEDYDPDYWDDQLLRVITRYSGKKFTLEMGAEMQAEMTPIYTDQREAARAAFPWVEVWFEETDEAAFLAALERRMTDEDAIEIRRLRADENYSWRSIAGWAYDERRRVWRAGWTMPEHQEVGTLICRAAGRRLGEDEPWY